jgi:hypothetical protein
LLYRAKLNSVMVENSIVKPQINVSKCNASTNIMEILNEPVVLNSTYNKLADELGEVVSKYTLNLKVDDTSAAVVANFKTA